MCCGHEPEQCNTTNTQHHPPSNITKSHQHLTYPPSHQSLGLCIYLIYMKNIREDELL